ncbi:GNAT family N-acetyltransferase [Pseudooceanicola sp. LIPI14-2-Ac024]|uniref:GNAT family N-acetyltransferase n=1 Tax=Pseudooceanicola sp. LIPI14-2-Ac024 TaxID=3344875 RepID=UPI0035D0E975
MQPVRLTPDDDMVSVHGLLTGAFAYMEDRIDPPSSLTRMTPATFADEARSKELWVLNDPAPVACMVLAPQHDHLYLGKLAVAESHRGRGLARLMLDFAVERARALGLPRVVLQTRVELTENQATFTRLGFSETGRTAHAGYDRPTSITYARDVPPPAAA